MRRRGSTIILAILSSLMLVLVALPTASAAASTAPAATTARDPNTTLCPKMAQTLSDGMKKVLADLRKVSTQASAGDLTGAQVSVKQAGKQLVQIGTDLRAQAKTADDQKLRAAVDELAAEFEQLGGSLTDLTALQDFNTTKIQEKGKQVSKLCGGLLTPQPSRTS